MTKTKKMEKLNFKSYAQVGNADLRSLQKKIFNSFV